ncbi:MAG: hypothetical protein JSU59_07050 [Nitrospirota bacterium]|nr:MAG: hypothetical protein JSU59_07050 [Nitrospirota bacterium]
MSRPQDIEPSQVVEILGELIAALAAFAAKVPSNTLMAMSGGIRPTLEIAESYEEIVYRFRDRAGKSTFKVLTTYFLDSLEAFEGGRVFDAVTPLQQAVEQLVELHKEEKVTFTSAEQDRIREYYRRLGKILPETSKPEIDLPPPTSY